MSKISEVIEYCKPLLKLCEQHKCLKPDVTQIAIALGCSNATASMGLKVARAAHGKGE